MTLNPLKVFRHPGKTVEEFYKAPNLVIAAGLIILPILLNIVLTIAIGLMPNLVEFGIDIAIVFLSWVLGGVILYAIIWALKGKEVKGHLYNILTALSLTGLIVSVIIILFIILISVLLPAVIPLFMDINAGLLSSEQIRQSLIELDIGDDLFTIGTGSILVLAMGALFLLAIYVVYKTIQTAKPSGPFRNLIILVLYFVFFSYILNLILGAIKL